MLRPSASTRGTNPQLAHFRYLYWAAIRQDLVANTTAPFAAIRRVIAQNQTYAVYAKQLSDLRLLDIVAW